MTSLLRKTKSTHHNFTIYNSQFTQNSTLITNHSTFTSFDSGESKSVRKFPSAEGWHGVPGWFGMILFQRMLPEVCNFGIVLFISLLVQRNEPKKGHLPRGILASLNRSKNAAVNFIYLNLGIFLTILARKDVS